MKFRVDTLSRIFLKEDRQLCEGVERDEMYNLIFNPNNWEINNYDSFLNSLAKTPQKYRGFMIKLQGNPPLQWWEELQQALYLVKHYFLILTL